MKQTAVQFLYKFVQLKLTDEQQAQFEGLFQQAMQMEKEQIIDACKYANNFEQGDLRCEVYYKKKFKSE